MSHQYAHTESRCIIFKQRIIKANYEKQYINLKDKDILTVTLVTILMDLPYLLVAVIFSWFIRIAIKKETTITNDILKIQNDINGS